MTTDLLPQNSRAAAPDSRISTISNLALAAACAFVLIPLLYIYDMRAEAAAFPAEFLMGTPEADASAQETIPPAPQRASVLFVGDMMFDRGVRTKILASGEDEVFASTTRFLTSQFDLAIGNLEGPITSSASQTVDGKGKAIPGFTFTFPPSTARLLQKSGIDIVSLANNHAGNFGPAGFRETVRLLDESGVGYFGNASNDASGGAPSGISSTRCIKADDPAQKLCISLVGFHQFAAGGEPAVLEEVRRLSAAASEDKASASFIVVFPHWGNEYEKNPTAEQRRLAHAWIDVGADAVIGAHPHIIQSIETYAGKPVFYSLGNYIFDQYFSYDTTHGLAIGMDIENGALRGIRLMPLDITGTKVRIAGESDRARILKETSRISTRYTSTPTRDQIEKGEITF